MILTQKEFEARCNKHPDMELGWQYWNCLLPDTTGYALWLVFIKPELRKWTRLKQ